MILVIGHPRCGTGFTSYLLQKLGKDIGHEEFGKDGISSWAFSVRQDKLFNQIQNWGLNGGEWRRNYNFDSFKTIIVCIRNPFDALPAIIAENDFSPSFLFRRHFLNHNYPGILNSTYKHTIIQKLEIAIKTYIYWYKMIEKTISNTFFYRIEHDISKLNDYLKNNGIIQDDINIDLEILDKKVNSKVGKYHLGKYVKYEVIKYEHFKQIKDKLLIKELNDFCLKYNYPTLEKYYNI